MESAESTEDPTDKVQWLDADEIEDRPTTRALPIAPVAKPLARPKPQRQLPFRPTSAPAPWTPKAPPQRATIPAAAPRAPNISPRPIAHPHPKVAPAPAVVAAPAPAPAPALARVVVPAAPATPVAPAVSPPTRKRHAKRKAPRFQKLLAAIDQNVGLAQLETSSAPRTFGATMTRGRNSRVKYVVAFLFAAAAIAAVVVLNWHK